MKPPLTYYGGKQRMTHNILPLIPKHTVYVEPFAGGAAVLFAKPWPDVSNAHHYREVINDKERLIINFYQQLRDNGPALCEKLLLSTYSEADHRDSKAVDDVEDKLEAARLYFVNTQQSFATKKSAGWGRGVFGSNLAFRWLNKIASLPDYVERMASVHIACDDALKIIKSWDSPQTFFYCDPPYPGTNCGHYDGYSIENFKELVQTLKNAQGSFILSNYDQPGVEIPSDWERFEFEAFMSSSGKGKVGSDKTKMSSSGDLGDRKRTEVVWRRFNRLPVRPEIQRLYDSGAYDCFVTNPNDVPALYDAAS